MLGDEAEQRKRSTACAVPWTKTGPKLQNSSHELIVLLDAGPLGMITNPKSSSENEDVRTWPRVCLPGGRGHHSGIADYEYAGIASGRQGQRMGRLDRKGMLDMRDHDGRDVAPRSIGDRPAEGPAVSRRRLLGRDMILAAQPGRSFVRCEPASHHHVRHLPCFVAPHLARNR